MSVMETVKTEVAHICAIKPEQISEDAMLIQYGLDSLRSMDLIVAMEERFGIEVPDDNLARLKTISDVSRLIEQNLNIN